MISEPLFSVILPVRNGESYIAQAIESVLAQTYSKFDLLILENKSTDHTLEIIQSYFDPRIKIIPALSPLSIEENWGRIIEQTTNEYITFMGHDDLLYPDFLTEIVSLINAEPTASLYQAQFEDINSFGKPVRRSAGVDYKETASQFLTAVMDNKEEYNGTGYVMRSTDYRKVGGIPSFPGLLYADVVLWYQLVDLGYKVCSPKTLVGFRVHPQSMHRKANLSNYYLAIRQYYEFLCTINEIKANPKTVYTYINRQLQLSYRIAVVQSLAAPDEGRVQLQMAKQQIAKDALFTLTDPVARVYEAVVTMPSWLRRLSLLPIAWRRSVLRFLANR